MRPTRSAEEDDDAGSQEHAHERGHIVDSVFHGHMYSTPASRRIFCDLCRLRRWLDVEAALALSQEEVGLLPQNVGSAIAATATGESLDIERIRTETQRTAHSLVGVLRVLQDACPDGTGEFVHYGATTQDIEDTAQALEMRDVLDEMLPTLCSIVEALIDIAGRHAGTVTTGRTHAQPALPTTFGLKVAGWIDEIMRGIERLDEMKTRVLVAELFGGVGTMAAFAPDGLELLQRFSKRLGLGAPMTAWHVARDRVAEYVFTLASICATLGRVADEVRMLSKPEFGEIEQHWPAGKVGSSTMPHKRNPEECEQVVVLARLAGALVGVSLQAMINEHERDSRGLRTEWVTVADVSHYALSAAQLSREIIDGISVQVDAMAANAATFAPELGTERLMLLLGKHMGKQSAHELVYELSQASKDHRRSLSDEVVAHHEKLPQLTDAQLASVFEPANNIGAAAAIVETVVREASVKLSARRATFGGEP